jgi:hypothetical protein
LFVGRAVAALAADPKVQERTGMLYSSWELARVYGLTDYDDEDSVSTEGDALIWT